MTAKFQPTGYLINEKHGECPTGDRGTGYDYILASNGIFVRSESPLMQATALHTQTAIRGLAPLNPSLLLKKGLIPRAVLHQMLSAMRRAAPNELFAAVTWDEDTGYSVRIPEQQANSASVSYTNTPGTILQMHSHGDNNAFFSLTDDQDEQGFALYGVAGHVTTLMQVAFRVGVYGHFQPAPVGQIFAPQEPGR